MGVHLLYPQLLDDLVPEERKIGIQMGLRVLTACDELWLCGSRISTGMRCELAEAKRLGIPVKRISKEQIQGGLTIMEHCKTSTKCIPEEAPPSGIRLQY